MVLQPAENNTLFVYHCFAGRSRSVNFFISILSGSFRKSSLSGSLLYFVVE